MEPVARACRRVTALRSLALGAAAFALTALFIATHPAALFA